YEGKAGPLKEWQHAEAKLLGAQNDMRSAETALEAARNRLRIFGLTDEEISGLERTGAIRRSIPIFSPIEGTVVARKVGPGQFASVQIATSDPAPTAAVPTEAVVRDSQHATVWVQEAPMVFRRRVVQTGMEQDGRIQIRDGLKPGELAVARGAIFLDNEWRQ